MQNRIHSEKSFLLIDLKENEILYTVLDHARTTFPKDFVRSSVTKLAKKNTLLPVHFNM